MDIILVELETKLSLHHPENPQTILALLRQEPNRPLSMRAMTKMRQRKSVARVMVPMKMSDACVRIHSAGPTRIRSIESRAVRPGPMHGFPNPEARLLSKDK